MSTQPRPDREVLVTTQTATRTEHPRPSRRFFPIIPPKGLAPVAPPQIRSMLGAIVSVGVLAGLLEWAAFSFQIHVLHRVGLSTLKISRHASWMVPAAGASVSIGAMIALTLPSLLIAKFRTGRFAIMTWDLCGWILGTFLVLGPILSIRGLHGGAALFLSIAIGYRLRHTIARPTRGWTVAARWAGVVAITFLPAYSFARWNGVASAESRAWSAPAPAPGTPNLIWIVLDTVRADHLSLYGYHRPTSPSLEAWAKRGITFDQARSAAPWTLPSHLTMFTGLWPHEHGGRVDRPYSGNSPTLAEHLAANGYATAGFAANTGMCNACFGVGRGFDYYLDHPCNHEVGVVAALRNSVIGTHALRLARKVKIRIPIEFPFRKVLVAPEIASLGREWLESTHARNANGSRRPSFLFMNFMDAHGPYIPPRDRPTTFWKGPELTPKEVTPETGWFVMSNRDSATPANRPRAQAELDAITNRLVDIYDDCLAGLDAEVGRFLDDMKSSGRLDDTWVVITSDHGEHFGEHGQFGHGTSLYDDLTHVPLLLIPPAKAAIASRGRRIEAPVSLRDLPATMSGLLLPESTSPFPGRSLARHWLSPGPVEPDPVLSQQEEQHLEGNDVKTDQVKTMDAVLDHGFVLITGSERPDELYQLATDPKQLHDLANDPGMSGTRDRLHQMLDEMKAKR